VSNNRWRYYLTMMSCVAAAFLICGSAYLSVTAQDEKRTLTRSSYERARAVLDGGIEALGGLENLRKADRVTIRYRATGHPVGQNAAYTAPPINVERRGARTLIDYSGGRYVSEGEAGFPGGYRFNFRQVIAPKRSFSIDLLRNRRGNTIFNLTPRQQEGTKLGALLEVPHLLLVHVLERAETLRWLGETTLDGRSFQVISFAAETGAQISLYFDARTKLLTRYESIGSNPVMGDIKTGGIYSEYQMLGGIRLPKRRLSIFGSHVSNEDEYREVTLDFAAERGLLEVPEGYVEAVPATGEAAAPVRKMGDGVYLLQNLPGGYRVMFMEFADHVMVLEAPTDASASKAAIGRIKQLAPAKPIRYVSFSHFHFDHTGGLRQYIAEGATIVIPPGNRPFVEALAKSGFTIRPDALSLRPRAPVIETFTGKRVFTDGTRTLELYSIGPVSHVNDMVMFYFPKEKILFQGDMFSMTEAGTVPPVIEINRELARKVEELGLEVESLIGVHGGAVPWKTFYDAVNKDRTPTK
jgi:glyoxylase-like metal-dependent hydrolase (beta-lactamase superfamily II)